MSGILALDPGLDDVGGTADAGSDPYCAGGAVCGAGAAFHAAVAVRQLSFAAFHPENAMGTDSFAHRAAGAFFHFKLQGRDIIEISEIFHMLFQFAILLPAGDAAYSASFYRANGAATQATAAAATATAWRGIPWRISFSTPEGEVKGVAPVKFMAA